MNGFWSGLPGDKRRELAIWLIASFILLSAIVVFMIKISFDQRRQIEVLKNEVNLLNKPLSNFDADLKKKGELKKQANLLEHKLKKWNSYSLTESSLAFNFMDGISKSIPENIFVNEISYSSKKGIIEIQGFSKTPELVSSFGDNLAKLVFAKSVKLNDLSKAENENYPIKYTIFITTKDKKDDTKD